MEAPPNSPRWQVMETAPWRFRMFWQEHAGVIYERLHRAVYPKKARQRVFNHIPQAFLVAVFHPT